MDGYQKYRVAMMFDKIVNLCPSFIMFAETELIKFKDAILINDIERVIKDGHILAYKLSDAGFNIAHDLMDVINDIEYEYNLD